MLTCTDDFWNWIYSHVHVVSIKVVEGWESLAQFAVCYPAVIPENIC